MSASVDALCARIRSLIRENEVRPGDRIGDERSLADSLGVPRSRLRAALDLLESDGLVRRRIGRGGGVVASDGRLERNLSTIEGLPQIARASGQDTRLLDLGPHDHVYRLLRLRIADGRPLSLELSRLPTAAFPDLLRGDLTSLYALLRTRYGVWPVSSDETLELTLADDEQALHLDVEAGTPLIHVHRVTTGSCGRPIEIGREHFVGASVRFHLRKHGYARQLLQPGHDAGRLPLS